MLFAGFKLLLSINSPYLNKKLQVSRVTVLVWYAPVVLLVFATSKNYQQKCCFVPFHGNFSFLQIPSESEVVVMDPVPLPDYSVKKINTDTRAITTPRGVWLLQRRAANEGINSEPY